MTDPALPGPDTEPLSEQAIEAIWGEAMPRLIRFIGKSVTRDQARDIAQETAIRALRVQLPFTDADDLLRWCQVVARRLVTDQYRRDRVRDREPLDAEWADHLDHIDHTERVHARDLLDRTFTAIDDLPRAEREAILGLLDPFQVVSDRPEQLRLAAARCRARIRLRNVVGYPAVLLGWLSLWRRGRLSPNRALALAPAALICCVSLVPFLAHPDQGAPGTRAKAGHTPATLRKSGVNPLRGTARPHAIARPAAVPGRPPTMAPPSHHPVYSVNGPAGIGTSFDDQPPPGAEHHLLCTNGTIVPVKACIG